jgi:chromosome partitioning protein
MAKLLETVQLVNKRMNSRLGVGGIVLTMFDNQAKLSHEVIHELESFVEAAHGKGLPWTGARVFATRIRRNIKLAESPSFGKPIFDYDAASNGAVDYRNLARELMDAFEASPKLETTVTPAAKIVADRTAAPATQDETAATR